MRFIFLMIIRSLNVYALFNVPCYKDYTVHVMVVMFCFKTCYCLLNRSLYLKAFTSLTTFRKINVQRSPILDPNCQDNSLFELKQCVYDDNPLTSEKPYLKH